MKIQVVDIAAITPYFNNPRDNANAVEPVKESIVRYGFIKPLVCDNKGVIIVGHTRYFAALRLDLTRIPVVFADLPDEQVKQYRIADNKLAEKSFYDETRLIEELKSLEIPESMQAFFFEDLNSKLNFSFESVTSSDTINDSTESSECDSDNEFQSEIATSQVENSELANQSNSNDEFQDLYRIKVVDGVRTMKVFCPYCNHVETLNLDKYV